MYGMNELTACRVFRVKQREHMGYEIGFRYIEKIFPQLKFIGSEPLDIMKYICTEFWEELFKKKVRYNDIYAQVYLFEHYSDR